MKNLFPFLVASLFGCHQNGHTENSRREAAIEEIRQSELNFSALAAEAGIPEAFLHYAADEAILVRNEEKIEGKPAIQAYFDARHLPGVQLSWSPEKVDASLSGDMGYSVGSYMFSLPDSTGQIQTTKGVYRTVWKRQPNGEWKFVLD